LTAYTVKCRQSQRKNGGCVSAPKEENGKDIKNLIGLPKKPAIPLKAWIRGKYE
jgi:hypothetical protein